MRLVALEDIFGEDEAAPQVVTEKEKMLSAIDVQIQRRMGDIAKIREMYNDVVRESGDSDEVKQMFIERLGNMIYASQEGQKSTDGSASHSEQERSGT